MIDQSLIIHINERYSTCDPVVKPFWHECFRIVVEAYPVSKQTVKKEGKIVAGHRSGRSSGYKIALELRENDQTDYDHKEDDVI